MGVFEAVVDDADADSLARVPHGVHGHDVQAQVGKVRAGAGVLLETIEVDNSYIAGTISRNLSYS